jgi:hypothetical protein
MTKTAIISERRVLKLKKSIWRLFNNHSPHAKPVYILGVQRSGTTLLAGCFEKSMDFDVFREISPAMVNFRIKDDATITSIITSSRHGFVVFKPLTDSHRATEFLALRPESYAIWMFRRADDRANSAVAKSGNHNLEVLRDLAHGRGFERWQAQGLTDEDLTRIRTYNYENMSRHDAAALLWYLRNGLFFNQGLDQMPNVLPLAYEDLVSDPKGVMGGVCQFLQARFTESMVSSVHARSIGKSESHLSEDMVRVTDQMYQRLHDIQDRRWREHHLNASSTRLSATRNSGSA